MSVVCLHNFIKIHELVDDEGVFIFNDKLSSTSFLPAPYSRIVDYIKSMTSISVDDLKLFVITNFKILDADVFDVDNFLLELSQQQIIKIND